MKNFVIAISVLAGFAMISAVSFFYIQTLKAFNTQQARDAAVDGCMQNARYAWQEKNPRDLELVNQTDEPNRFWYKLCMEEKGYEVRIKI